MSQSTKVDRVREKAEAWLDTPYGYKGYTSMNIMLPDPEMAATKYGEGSIEHRFEVWSLACQETAHALCGKEYHRCTDLGRQFAHQDEEIV